MDSLLDSAILATMGLGYAAVQEYVKEAWMDEIFHAPQTQQYYNGNWSVWDDKITTPPGLYVLGWIAGKIAGNCSIKTLRVVNIVGLACGSWAVARLLRQSVFSYLITFPLLYFFSLLYYTDVWSTILVLIGLGLTLRKYHLASASILTVSLAFRQTNIIWAGFAAVCALMDLDIQLDKLSTRSGMDSLLYQFNTALHNILSWTSVPYVFVAAVFGVFLYINEGITMGDKQNHQMSLNFPQIFYFALFSLLFSAPLLITKIAWIQQYIKSRLRPLGFVRYLCECGLIYVIATRLKVVHPFILADNRHYTFYMWRRILDRADGLSVLLVPVYHLALRWLFETPFCLHTLVFWLGLMAVLVPSPLLEPRYYLLGFLIWRLIITKWRISRFEVLWNILISGVTTYVFCTSQTHFMW